MRSMNMLFRLATIHSLLVALETSVGPARHVRTARPSSPGVPTDESGRSKGDEPSARGRAMSPLIIRLARSSWKAGGR